MAKPVFENRKYSWAVNQTKLAQTIKRLDTAKLLDPRIEINEETIKEDYVLHAGLLREDLDETKPLPKVTTNRADVKISVRE